MLTRQLVTRKKHELWFLVSGNPIRFTLREFEEVTGLNCEPIVEEESGTGDENDFFKKLDLQGSRISPTLLDLVRSFSSGTIQSREDRLRVAYLIIVASVVVGRDRRTAIPRHISRMVIDLNKFLAYPWGRVGFKTLVAAAKNTDFSKPSYVMDGFAQVIQAWAYSVIPKIGEGVGVKISDSGPMLLRYQGSKGKVDLEDVGDVDISGLGARPTDWEDEVHDEQVEKLLEYYDEHKSFEGITWLSVGKLGRNVTTPKPTDKKRKGKEVEVEVEESERGKKKSLVGHDAKDGPAENCTAVRFKKMEERIENVENLLMKVISLLSPADVMTSQTRHGSPAKPRKKQKAKKKSPTQRSPPEDPLPPLSRKASTVEPQGTPPKERTPEKATAAAGNAVDDMGRPRTRAQVLRLTQ